MKNLQTPDVQIDEILTRIRTELVRKSTAGQNTENIGGLGRTPTDRVAVDLPAFVPSFRPNLAGIYRAKDLLTYDDREFILVAYLAILRRPADTKGLEDYLRSLRAGRKKASILGSLSSSVEGKRAGSRIQGLWWRRAIADLWRVDLLRLRGQ